MRGTFHRRLLPAVATLGLVMLGGCAPHRARPNVVIIVVDTLRADGLGCYGAVGDPTPAIDRLAAKGIRFERCVSQAPWTLPSVATLLSGRYPTSHGADNFTSVLPKKLRLMAQDFRAAGYATGAVVSHRFVSIQKGFDRGFDSFDQSNTLGHDAVTSPGVTKKALQWLGKIEKERKTPFFLFLHYFDPHYSYMSHEGNPPGPPYDGPLKAGMDIWELRKKLESASTEDLDFVKNLYAGEIRFTDGEIGKVFDYLEERQIARNTVIVFTADHGEEFMEHGWLGHTKNLYDNLVLVPLIIRYPGGDEGSVRRDPAMLVDLFATIENLAGLEAHPTEGRDLFGDDRSDRPCVSEVEFDPSGAKYLGRKFLRREMEKRSDMRSIYRAGWKAIENRITGEWELFDITNDPGEIENVAGRETDRLEDLRGDLAKWERSIVKGTGEAEPLDSAQIEELRALGYIR